MKEYFQLQFKLVNRSLIDFGLPLIIGYILIPLLFIIGSEYLFLKIEYAAYMYVFIALGLVSRLNKTNRNEFLKSIFCTSSFLKIRMLENLIFALSFTLFLIYKEKFIIALLLNIFSLFLVLINFNTSINFIIPTPFGKNPFEFVVGFRKTFFMFPIAYFITYMAIKVSNFNLGIFSLILIGILCYSYYTKPENEYFVWNFKLSPKEFLIQKITSCLLNFILLALPIILALGIFFINNVDILLVITILICAFLMAIVLAKYSAFPNEISIPQGLLLALCFLFPPGIIVLIPYFYIKSKQQLTSILHDSD